MPSWALWAPLWVAAVMGCVTLDGDWVYDDRHAILQSPVVQGEVAAVEALSRDFWGHALGNPSKVSWRPALPLLWRALWSAGGGAAWLLRSLNLMAHVLATWALMRLIGRMHGRRVAWVSTMLFAVHPVHAEALGAVVAQADLFAAAFGFLALGEIVRRGRAGVWVALVWLVCGALFKETVALYAIVGAAWLIASRRQQPGSYGHVGALMAFVAVVVAIQSVAHGGHAEQPVDNVLAALSWPARAVNGLAIGWRGLRVLFMPYDVAANHGYGAYSEDTSGQLLNAVLGGGALVVALALGMRWLLLGGAARTLWLCLAAGPIVAQTHLLFVGPTEFAERLLYAGVAPVCVGLATMVCRAYEDGARRRALAVCAVLVAAGSTMSWRAQRPWRSPVTLWEHAYQVEPLAWRVHHNLGDALSKSGEGQRGLWHLMIGAWLKRRLPRPVHGEVLSALSRLPASERILLTPGVLSKEAPCVLIDDLLRVAYGKDTSPANARRAKALFASRYPCAR